ncbi:MAG: methionine--tRNA ligase, partial [Thermofilum sp.]
MIPSSAERIWNLLGYNDNLANHLWIEALEPLPPGQDLLEPKPLFSKITDEDIKAAVQKIESIRERISSQQLLQ